MNESYISPKTGKPYYGAAAQNHLIYTINGSIEKYNENVGKAYLAESLSVLVLGATLIKPVISAIKIIRIKQKERDRSN